MEERFDISGNRFRSMGLFDASLLSDALRWDCAGICGEKIL